MAFEGLFRKRRLDSSENQDESQQRQEESGAPVMNRGPQEPVLPDREALEREAEELFVSKEKKPVKAFERTESSAEQKAPYTGDAEVKELPPQDAAMTKARTDVLDILARIEKAGLPISLELIATVKNELVNLASEAARIEFQEAERADPVLILRGILEELGKKQTITPIKDALITGLKNIVEQTEETLRIFRTQREVLIQQGITNPSDAAILGRVAGFRPAETRKRILVVVPLYSTSVKDREACAAELLKELGVFAAGVSLSLGDLFTAIKGTGRTTAEQGEPYYVRTNLQLIGLTSTRPELKGLSLVVDAGGNSNEISISLFGDFSFWLRVIESAKVLEKNF